MAELVRETAAAADADSSNGGCRDYLHTFPAQLDSFWRKGAEPETITKSYRTIKLIIAFYWTSLECGAEFQGTK